ncbi:DMT family transporter [Flavobacterium sp. HSC-61S13]|uniref:DMT family transporter n=1 Tax=Flavobacterium sp. HSC-61S13 TaxID=2910963 RepID=UPI00209E95BA|nr:DMT family transporter [Flavobacterium sp. HSC-61S13]MCP1995762.1 drug/metabolite transporter (DMT)-like permease [Flavobacterium sp. HSC-61S13]
MLGDNLKSYLNLHFIVFIWGFTAVLGQLISLEALPLVWYRIAIAVSCLFVYFMITRRQMTSSTKSIGLFLLAGIVIAVHWLTFFGAIKASNVSVTLACISTGAFFASILEPIFYKRKVVWYEVVFGLIVILGLSIIFSVETQYLTGIVLGLISAFLSAVFSIINGKFAQKHDPGIITFYELLGGLLVLTIFLALSGGFTKEFFTVQSSDWLWLILLGSFCTAYAFLASVKVMKFLSPYTVMLTINLEPVYGILLAVLIFKDSEKMTPAFYIGALLILSTVILNGIVKNAKKTKVIKN